MKIFIIDNGKKFPFVILRISRFARYHLLKRFIFQQFCFKSTSAPIKPFSNYFTHFFTSWFKIKTVCLNYINIVFESSHSGLVCHINTNYLQVIFFFLLIIAWCFEGHNLGGGCVKLFVNFLFLVLFKCIC